MIRRMARSQPADKEAARSAFQSGLELIGEVTQMQLYYLSGYRQGRIVMSWEWRTGEREPVTMQYLVSFESDWQGQLKRAAAKVAAARRELYPAAADRAVG